MPSRSTLELRAAAVNILPATYPNDSQLEQVVLAAEKALTASGAASTRLPSNDAIRGTN